jgi:N-acyl-phosphatidylethanolamine-hydrolysing phospholipase D
MRATWIGHATVLAEIGSTKVITDPIFSNFASPVQFGPFFKRYRPPACSVTKLPSDLAAVVISHTHYDHLVSQ